MALTKSLIANTVFGNQRVVVWDVSPDAGATSFSTSLGTLAFAMVTAASADTDATFGVFTENQLPAGTASAGDLAMTSVVDSGEIKYRCVCLGAA